LRQGARCQKRVRIIRASRSFGPRALSLSKLLRLPLNGEFES
jgi:hypothetical protein